MAAAAAVQTLMGPNYPDWRWDCTHALALTGYYDAVFGGAEASEGAAPATPAGNGTPAVRVQLSTPSESAAPEGDRSVPGTPQTAPPVSADLDRRAHAFISLTLDRSRYRLLCEAHRTARGLWDALARMHTQELLATRGPVLEQITHLRMTPEQSVTDYWLHAEHLHATANQSGSFKDTMHFALRGLPPDYDVITNPLLTQRPEDVTFAAVLPKLQMQEQILQSRRSADVALSAHSSPAGRGRSNNRGRGRGCGTSSSPVDMSRRVCYNCGEPGHYQADCPRPQRTSGSHTPAARSHGAHRASTPPARSSSPSSSPVHRVHLASSSRTFAFTGVCAAATDQLQGMWLIDSACSKHITPRDDYQLLQPPHQILCANNSVMAAQGQGTVRFKTEDGEFQLQHVLHVPGASSSLLSLGRAVRAGIMPKFSKAGCQLTAPHMAPLTSKLQGDLFVIDQQPIPVLDSPGSLCMAARMAQSPLLWHYRFAHSSCRRLANMVRHSMVLGIDVSAAEFERHDSSSTLCEPCIMGKQHRWVEPQHAGLSRPAQQVLELVHSDVCGPMEVAALDGSLYYVSLLDDYSKVLAVTLIKQKSDAAAAIIDMVTALERQTGSKLKALRSDRGGEYTGAELQRWLRTQGVVHQLTAPYSPEMNGSAERVNRTVLNMVRTMMDAVSAPKPLWGEAAKAAAMIHNVSSVAGQPSPRGRIRVSKSVVVDEAAVLPRTAPAAAVDDEPEAPAEVAAPTPVGAASGGTGAGASGGPSGPAAAGGGATPAAPAAASGGAASADAAAARTASKVPAAPAAAGCDAERSAPAAAPAAEKPYNLRPRPTKPSKSVSFSDTVSLCFLGSDSSGGSNSSSIDPQSYEEAMARPDAADWLRAMNKEMACQQANQTWQLVKQQGWMRVLPGRWVFKTKRGADSSILKHKARFVIKGYRQVEGVDFDDSFAPVVTQGTQRVLLSVAAARGWELQQLDVETAFLNAPVDEGRLVYCQQPPGFETGQGLVCQLDKAVYGLRQAPRAWYQHLTQQLGLIGFTASAADPCLIQPAQRQAACAASFLGMRITRDLEAGTLKLDQQHYIEQLLDRFSMTAANGRVLPMTPGTRLVKEGSPLDSSSAHRYRELVGALLYASTCTRPDIAFAVGQLSRFMQAPTQQHQQVAFGLLRYLKRTAEMGLVYSRSSSPQLQGYVDADYAGDPDSMRSTTGSVFVLNGAAVTWRSKLQTTVAASTTEAEYQAAAAGTKEALFLRKLLHELDAGCDPIPILCDNQGAVALIKNPVESHRSRHTAVAHHISRERMVRGEVVFSHCPSAEMVADALTKPVSAQLFEGCFRGVGVG
ncbi:hypothetical protein QJQ45_006215 [Haematococcus lacustris]|nr:hypothetical protein QJQ45_006215 [Haematococcus lacustris]